MSYNLKIIFICCQQFTRIIIFRYATKKEEVSPRVLQALNTILKSPFHGMRNGILSGRSFYIPSEPRLDLGDHFDLCFGLFQSVVLCNRVLLNVDITHKGFPKRYDSLVELWNIIKNDENKKKGKKKSSGYHVSTFERIEYHLQPARRSTHEKNVQVQKYC